MDLSMPQRPQNDRKISTSIYLTPEQHARLKLLSTHTKIPFAVLIRQAVDACLERNQSVFEDIARRAKGVLGT